MNQLHELVGRQVIVCVDQIGLKVNIRGVLSQDRDGAFCVTDPNANMRFSAGKVSNIFEAGENGNKSPRIELF